MVSESDLPHPPFPYWGYHERWYHHETLNRLNSFRHYYIFPIFPKSKMVFETRKSYGRAMRERDDHFLIFLKFFFLLLYNIIFIIIIILY